MSISLYDEAVYKLIYGRVKDSKMRILRPEESKYLFQMRADMNNDKPITLPLVSISRNNNIEILSTQKQPLSFDGVKMQINPKEAMLLSRIPIKLEYQLDIWTQKELDCENWIREFVFLLINNPIIEITLPYHGANFKQQATIRLANEIVDNSDADNKLFKDQYTRMTLTFNIDDANLYSIPIKQNAKISDVQLRVLDNNNQIDEEEIIYSNEEINC